MTSNAIPALIRDIYGGYRVTRQFLSDEEILVAAEDIIERRFYRLMDIGSSASAKEFLRSRLIMREEECFCVIYLDNRHRIIQFREEFRGTIDGATIYPRVILKQALQINSAAVILAHNHPSGSSEPSQSDRVITDRIKEALSLVEIRVLDHLIIGYPNIVSFSERGYL